MSPVRVRVLRPLEEPVGGLVRHVDLRQPHEEPRLLPARPHLQEMSARAVAAAALGFAAVLPLFLAAGGSAMENLVLAAAYVVMALGLNVVVGFAGLLDLGYVAFFAIGAHVAAHFGSGF